MVESVSAAQWQQSQDALRDGVAGDSMIRGMWDNADMNALGMKSDPERELAVLADRIEERALEYLKSECAGHSPDEPRLWLVEGTTVPLFALTCNLLNETIMHGYDIAHVTGRKWRIEPTHAATMVRNSSSRCYKRSTLGRLSTPRRRLASYELHLRGDGRLIFVFDDGSLRVEESSARRVDCRQSQWNAIAKGQLIAWGRKPWLGVKFRFPDPQPLAVCPLALSVVGKVFGMRMSDLPSVEVSLTLAAPPERVWALASDVTRVGAWGGECVKAAWVDGADGPAVGAHFLGHQVWGDRKWETTSVVIESEPGVSFAWAVGDPANAAATWRYQMTADGSGGTVLHYRAVMGPGPSGLTAVVAEMPDREEIIIARRMKEHERNMTATLEAIKRVAE